MRKFIAAAAVIGAAGISLTLGGCDKAQGGGDADGGKQAIQADEAKWNKDLKAKDTDALDGHYADDSYFVAPGEAPANGSTAIRQIFANASTDPAFAVQISGEKIEVAASGDIAYSRGKYSEKYTDAKTGKVMAGSGTYLAIYKKQDDGSWKIVEDFAAPDKDSTKPVPPEKPAVRAKMTSFG